MRHAAIGSALAAAFLATACDQPQPTAVVPVVQTAALVENSQGLHAAVPLSGDEEVPSRPTRARGNAIFTLSDDGESIRYRLIVANIDNVVASHVHLGAAETNGPVVVFLFGPAPSGGGASNGVLAEGEFSAANFVGPLAGQPLSAFLDAMRAGSLYVNVHTNDGVGSPNTGPGDFPGGEVRGQIR